MLLCDLWLRKPFPFERNFHFKQVFVIRVSSNRYLNEFLFSISILLLKIFAAHVHLDTSPIRGGRNGVSSRLGKWLIKSGYTTPNRRVVIVLWNLSKRAYLPGNSFNSPIIIHLCPKRLKPD